MRKRIRVQLTRVIKSISNHIQIFCLSRESLLSFLFFQFVVLLSLGLSPRDGALTLIIDKANSRQLYLLRVFVSKSRVLKRVFSRLATKEILDAKNPRSVVVFDFIFERRDMNLISRALSDRMVNDLNLFEAGPGLSQQNLTNNFQVLCTIYSNEVGRNWEFLARDVSCNISCIMDQKAYFFKPDFWESLHKLKLIDKKLISEGKFLAADFWGQINLIDALSLYDLGRIKENDLKLLMYLSGQVGDYDQLEKFLKFIFKSEICRWKVYAELLSPPRRPNVDYYKLAKKVVLFKGEAISVFENTECGHTKLAALSFLVNLAPDDHIVSLVNNYLRLKLDECLSVGETQKFDELYLVYLVVKGFSGLEEKLVEDIVELALKLGKPHYFQTVYAKKLSFDGGKDLLSELDNSYGKIRNYKYFNNKSMILRHLGDFEASLKESMEALSRAVVHFLLYGESKFLWSIDSILTSCQELRFLTDTYSKLNFKRVDKPEGLVYFLTQNVRVFRRLPHVAAEFLANRNWAIVGFSSGIINNDLRYNGAGPINEAYRTIANVNRELKNNWEIDWANRKVICKGINYYQGIYERLTIWHRRLTIDISQHPIDRQFYSLLRMCDRTIDFCESLEKEALNYPNGIKVLTVETLGAPHSVVRKFFEYRESKVEVIYSSISYENYYSNLSTKVSSKISIANVTKEPTRRAPFIPSMRGFLNWFGGLSKENLSEFSRRAKAYVEQNRSNTSVASGDKNFYLNLFKDLKKKNFRIVTFVGKVPCDLGLPEDGGNVFNTTGEWLMHGVQFAELNKDVHIFVKPHPHELRQEIALFPTEKFRDLLPSSLPDNFHFLPHTAFNLYELAKVTDLAVLWNGSSNLEFGLSGTQVVLCTKYGHWDYPVGHLDPESKSEYESILKLGVVKKTEEIEDIKVKCAAYLEYMKSPEVSIPYGFVNVPATNIDVWPPKWNDDLLEEYRAGKNSYVGEIAKRVTS